MEGYAGKNDKKTYSAVFQLYLGKTGKKNKNTKFVDQTELILMKPELNASIYNCIWATIWEKMFLTMNSYLFLVINMVSIHYKTFLK